MQPGLPDRRLRDTGLQKKDPLQTENIKNNKKIDLYYNHPIKSVNILKDINKYDDEFLDAIKYHHSNELYENNYLKVLKICDEKN